MKKVILTVGAPGSGKSTWAKEQAATSKGGARVVVLNRDNLRSMLAGENVYKYSRANEKTVTQMMRDTLTTLLLDHSVSTIIIADTNLNESTRKDYAAYVDDYIQATGTQVLFIEKPFQETWITLEKRNLKRGDKAVPKPVLRDMYLKMQKYMGDHKQYTPSGDLQKAVIFDLDGTLANNDHRGAFAYQHLDKDTPIEFVVNLARMYKQNEYEIICVSGRNAGDAEQHDKHWHATAQWLSDHKIPWDVLFMRGWNDNRADDIVKEEIFWNKISHLWDVECAFDDRDRVVEMWRRIGVNCAQVNFGEF